MRKYSEKILNNLLDSYERSAVYKSGTTASLARNVSFTFNEKNIPDYFDETNYLYREDIEADLNNLNASALISIVYGKGRESHIIKKVNLCLDNLEEAYKKAKRIPKSLMEESTLNILSQYIDKEGITGKFAAYCIKKIEEKESIKKYLDIENIKEMKEILKGLKEILSLEEETFKRILSARLYNDSKRLEALESKIIRIIKDFSDFKDIEDLSEFNLINNYNYVYFKGDIDIFFRNQELSPAGLKGGIAISSKDIEDITHVTVNAKRIITIENLTSFNNFNGDGWVVIYLGGYHNTVRRNLLKKIYLNNSSVEFYHWGDIDAGGFRILNHLRKRTGVNFIPLNMNLQMIEACKEYCRTLSDNDKKALQIMLTDTEYKEFHEVFQYMLENGVKLEQEADAGVPG
jgi:dGTP triphosphohydrolase